MHLSGSLIGLIGFHAAIVALALAWARRRRSIGRLVATVLVGSAIGAGLLIVGFRVGGPLTETAYSGGFFGNLSDLPGRALAAVAGWVCGHLLVVELGRFIGRHRRGSLSAALGTALAPFLYAILMMTAEHYGWMALKDFGPVGRGVWFVTGALAASTLIVVAYLASGGGPRRDDLEPVERRCSTRSRRRRRLTLGMVRPCSRSSGSTGASCPTARPTRASSRGSRPASAARSATR